MADEVNMGIAQGIVANHIVFGVMIKLIMKGLLTTPEVYALLDAAQVAFVDLEGRHENDPDRFAQSSAARDCVEQLVQQLGRIFPRHD